MRLFSRSRPWITRRFLLRAVALLLALTACRSPSGGSGAPEIVAAFYPLAFVAEQVGGDDVTVASLTRPGAEPHDLELTPAQVATVKRSALLLYLGSGFQPAVEDLAGPLGDRGMDVLTLPALAPERLEAVEEDHGEGHGEDAGPTTDPHVWLDPRLMAEITAAVRDRLTRNDPANAARHRERAGALIAKLEDLDHGFSSTLSSCERREIVTSHSAFGYLARRYGLTQVGITGLSPEAEPSPKRLAEVAGFAREHGVTTIFFETLVSPKVARTLASEIGVGTAVLDPIEVPPEEGDYVDAMKRNQAALRRALGCR